MQNYQFYYITVSSLDTVNGVKVTVLQVLPNIVSSNHHLNAPRLILLFVSWPA